MNLTLCNGLSGVMRLGLLNVIIHSLKVSRQVQMAL